MADPIIAVALIQAGATILAAIIGVAGVAAILRHRRLVIQLSKNVESYYLHESWLVEQLLKAQKKSEAPSQDLVKHWRGTYRKESGVDPKPYMNDKTAIAIRRRLISFD
jgi:hypothetical protein